MAIDDHSRAGIVQVHPDECKTSTVEFLKASVAHNAALAVPIEQEDRSEDMLSDRFAECQLGWSTGSSGSGV